MQESKKRQILLLMQNRKSKQTSGKAKFDNIFFFALSPSRHLESKIDKHCAKAYIMWSMIAWQHFLHKASMRTVPSREIVPRDEHFFGFRFL